MKINNKFFMYAASFMLIASTLISCNEEDATSSVIEDNFVSLEAKKRVVLPVDETQTFDFNVYASAEHSSDRTFNLVVNTDDSTLDPMYYSVPTTVTIPANSKVGTFQVSITGTGLETGKTIIVNLEKVAGTNFGNSPLTINVKELCEQNLVALDLIFDDYPEETSWTLFDADFNVIASAAPGEYDGLEDTSIEFCLSSGDYTFVIFDVYEDGMYDGTNTGSYNLIFLSPISSIPLAYGEGNFGANAIHEFTIE